MSKNISKTAPESEPRKGERIAKYLSRAGVCSRRDAEGLIAKGRVSVDGKILDTPATLVTGSENIEVNGKPVSRPEKARVWMMYKPSGLVTSHKDDKGRPTVFDSLPADMPRVMSVGRLDMNSEGLLLLTTSGGISRYLELPSTGLKRQYRVRVMGTVSQKRLDSLKDGITIDGIKYKGIQARMEKEQSGANVWLQVKLQEGKNREIRKVMEHLGLQVNRLIRTAYGPFRLGTMKPGDIEDIPEDVLDSMFEGTGILD